MLSKPERVSVSMVLQDQHGQSGTLNRVGSQPGTSVTEGAAQMFKEKEDGEVCVFRLRGSADGLDRYQDRNVRSPVPIEVQGDRRRPNGEKRITGCNTRWCYPPYRLNLTAYH